MTRSSMTLRQSHCHQTLQESQRMENVESSRQHWSRACVALFMESEFA